MSKKQKQNEPKVTYKENEGFWAMIYIGSAVGIGYIVFSMFVGSPV